MPDAPVSILPAPSAGSPPSAPPSVLAEASGGGAPTAPPAVLAEAAGGPPTLVITGSLSYSGGPLSFPPLVSAGDLNGRPAFSPDGDPYNLTLAFWNFTHWSLCWDSNTISYSSDDNVATPDLATTWYAVDDADGTPVVTLTGTSATAPTAILAEPSSGSPPSAPASVLP